MMLNTIARRLVGALFTTSIFAVSIPAPAIAQAVPTEVRIPCCRCLDGRPLRVNISTGAAPWQVAAPTGGGSVAAVPVTGQPTSWTTALGPAQWVNHPTAGMATGYYSYTLRIVVPRCIIKAPVSIAGRFATDNKGTLILGSSTPGLLVTSPSFTSPTAFGSATLAPGTHIITVRVQNKELQTGLVLNGAVTVRCPLERLPLDATATETEQPGQS